MGQLIIRFRANNPGITEVERIIELSQEELERTSSSELYEIEVDGKTFLRSQEKETKCEDAE